MVTYLIEEVNSSEKLAKLQLRHKNLSDKEFLVIQRIRDFWRIAASADRRSRIWFVEDKGSRFWATSRTFPSKCARYPTEKYYIKLLYKDNDRQDRVHK